MDTKTINNFYLGISDKLFKIIISESNIEFSKWFISKLLNIKVYKIKFCNTYLYSHGKSEKGKIVDILVEVNNELTLNIEANSSWSNRISKKNFSYMTSIYSQMIKVNSNYNNTGLISYDISSGLPEYYKNEEHMYMQNERGIKYIRDFEKCIINVDKIKKYWYNRDIKGIKKYAHILLLTMVPKEIEELIKYLSGKDAENAKKYREMIIMLNKNQKYVHPFTYEEQLKIDINTIKQDSYEEGIEHGIEQGIEQGFQKGIEKKQIETVENMAKEKIEPGIISKCVGLPLSRVQQIISSIIL